MRAAGLNARPSVWEALRVLLESLTVLISMLKCIIQLYKKDKQACRCNVCIVLPREFV